MSSCRSSGIKTASGIISSERCKLISIHAQYTGGGDSTFVKLFDNTAASGKELLRIVLNDTASPTSPNCIEFDMHGVICSNGLYLQIETGGNRAAAVSVEFN